MTKRILIVEDDKSIARLQSDYLEINGYEVFVEPTGDMDLIKRLVPTVDLVILDLMLPKNNGFEICKTLRRSFEVPIIIISAMTQDQDKILGLGLGADDYMTKPFSPSELVARVKSHLMRYDRLVSLNDKGPGESIVVRGMSINNVSKVCMIDGVEIELTPKEFEILVLLASNINRVFSKEEIYERIWMNDSLGDAGTVAVHIRRIREKMEREPSRPKYIETMWGVGYRMK